jgi:hypothetical protein
VPCCIDRVHREAKVGLGHSPAALRHRDAENRTADNRPLRRPCEDPVDFTRNPDASDVQVVEDTPWQVVRPKTRTRFQYRTMILGEKRRSNGLMTRTGRKQVDLNKKAIMSSAPVNVTRRLLRRLNHLITCADQLRMTGKTRNWTVHTMTIIRTKPIEPQTL